MRKLSGIRLNAGMLFAAAYIFCSPVAFAQTEQAAAAPAATTLSIAIVDVDEVMKNSVAAQSMRTQIEAFQKTFRDEIAKEESKLRARQQELQKLAPKTPPEQMAEKARAFDKEVADFRNKAELRSRALDKSYSDALETINKAMFEAISDQAAKNGNNIVMSRAQVMMFDETMNITKGVIEDLNKKLDKVTVEKPKVETPAAPAAAKPQK